MARRPLAFTALAVSLTLFAVPATAQQPSAAESQTPVQPAEQPAPPQPMDDQWLKQYDNKRSDALQQDPRFMALLADNFGIFGVTFWHKKSAVETYLDFMKDPGPVFVDDHRFVLTSGTMSRSPNDDGGLLWIDSHTDAETLTPWLVFCAFDAKHDKLYLFSSRDLLQGEEFPHNLRLNVGRWLGGWVRKIAIVDHVYIVSPSGTQEVRPVDVSVSLSHFTHR